MRSSAVSDTEKTVRPGNLPNTIFLIKAKIILSHREIRQSVARQEVKSKKLDARQGNLLKSMGEEFFLILVEIHFQSLNPAIDIISGCLIIYRHNLLNLIIPHSIKKL